MMRKLKYVLLGYVAVIPQLVHGNPPLSLNPPFGEDMILQRNALNALAGTAAPGKEVTIELLGTSVTGRSDETGCWKIKLPVPENPGGPYPLTVRCERENISLTNVLIGDLWLCSGQSNMVWPVRASLNGAGETAAANQPLLRLLRLPMIGSATPLDTIGVRWTPCVPDTASGFSGVGYFFGREITRATGVPVGLIQAAWSGQKAESFTRIEVLEKVPELAEVMKTYRLRVTPERLAAMSEKYASDLHAWEKARTDALSVGKPEPRRPRAPKGSSESGELPGTIWNGMLHPLLSLPITGVIWYQGEANTPNAPRYAPTLEAMIGDWRSQWRRDMPFFLVQLANIRPVSHTPEDSNWAALREAQSVVAKSVEKSGIALAIDVGLESGAHPPDKQSVGGRLALLALRRHYGKTLDDTGPVFEKLDIQGSEVRVFFRNGEGLHTRDGKPPRGFALAGTDGIYHWAEAEIDGSTVKLKTSAVMAPSTVRYAWAENPGVNLSNRANLPAEPFRTDNFLQKVKPERKPTGNGPKS